MQMWSFLKDFISFLRFFKLDLNIVVGSILEKEKMNVESG
jgi:hypothetical protein